MTPEQIQKIAFFSESEILATGAKLGDVQDRLFKALSHVRRELGRRVHLIHNGLTTGTHSAREHPDGLAADFYLDTADGPISQDTLYTLITAAVNAGFRGLGFYYNGKTWSFHLDLRSDMAMWTARKPAPGKGTWVYKRMLIGFPAR